MLNRRTFLRLAMALGLSPIVAACSRATGLLDEGTPSPAEPSPGPRPTSTVTPSPTPQPSPTVTPSPPPSPSRSPSPTEAVTEEDMMNQVALIRTDDRVAGVRRALELLNADAPAGGTVLLKPNYNSADPTPGSTHSDVLRTLMEWLGEHPRDSIVLAERSGMGETRRVRRMDAQGSRRPRGRLGTGGREGAPQYGRRPVARRCPHRRHRCVERRAGSGPPRAELGRLLGGSPPYPGAAA